ncbi:MAG TPA: glycosyltransferase, partial [Bacteroidales bacterium]|nr:glycosyltransferase [Bacteroidales bacterium]
ISDREILRNIYAASDLFLFPSYYDNYPLVMQEAAAFKVPTVVVDGSSCAEEIRDGINGFLIENTISSMVSKMEILMGSPDILRKAGEGARKTIYHPWENIVDSVFERYMDLIQHRNPGKFNAVNED